MARTISKRYTTRDSKWSGTTIVDDDKCRQEKIFGRKEWNCDILVSSKAGPKTYIHEMLHSRSASYLNRISYIRYARMEEASVEFLARKICEAEGIEFDTKPHKGVQALEQINSIVGVKEDDLSFAVALFVRDLKDRFKWLEAEVEKHIRKSPADAQKLLVLLESLRGMK